MATKRKGIIRRIVESIGESVRQPFSDESNETPTPAAVRRSKAVAAGPRPKAKKAKAKTRSTKKAR